MDKHIKILVFQTENQLFALPLSQVERVVRMVEMHSLAKAPDFILGTINFQGEFLPVINLRHIFRLTSKDIDLNDQLIISNSAFMKMALWIDFTVEIVEIEEKKLDKANRIIIDNIQVKGIINLNEKIVLLHDLNELLNVEQISLLERALQSSK